MPLTKCIISNFEFPAKTSYDPRVKDHYPWSSPLGPVLIVASYVYFVKKLGPKLMQNRKPFEIKTILMVYNLAQIFFNVAICLYINAISWESKEQRTVALSSTEAEYMALPKGTKEAISLQRLLSEITCHKEEAIRLYNDNQSAQKLANNLEFHNRTKHIDIRYHFVREAVANHQIEVVYLPTEQMVAGIRSLFKMNWSCALVDYSQSSDALLQLRLAYCFYMLKLFDLLDTDGYSGYPILNAPDKYLEKYEEYGKMFQIFFVLRKSTRQISFLHVYHHAGMVSGSFLAVNFFGGGELLWTGFINLIVHSIMFTYYYLTAVDKKWKKSIGFKKFLTQIQIIQFLLNIAIYGRLLFNNCPYPKVVPLLYIPQNVFMVILFVDFYLKSYVFRKKQ